MIWLSPASGTEECNIYFEIRDIDLQHRGNITSGVVRGLLGDGLCELPGEVFLGAEESAQLLPVWSEGGAVESFSPAVDETLLLQQLLAEVKTLLPEMQNAVNDRRSPDWQNSDPVPCRLVDDLAA